MKFVVNPITEVRKEIYEQIKANDGYCPCALQRTEDTKCMCTDFKQNVEVGHWCHCGLYYKMDDEEYDKFIEEHKEDVERNKELCK